MSNGAKRPLQPMPTTDQIRRILPHLSEKDANAYVSILRHCHDKGLSIDDLLGFEKEAKQKGLHGGAVFCYAGARIENPDAEPDLDDALTFQRLEDKHGLKDAMRIIDGGLEIASKAKKLGLSVEHAKRAMKDAAPFIKLARKHGLDPRVWSEIVREVSDDGLKGRAAAEAMIEKFMARVDRESWPKKDD